MAITDTIVLSFEAIIVELLYILTNIPTLAIAAGSIPIAGAMVLSINTFVFRNKLTILKGNGWKWLLVGAALFAIGDYTWYDAIDRIGAGKSLLLTMPTEDAFIVILAFVILAERLLKLQLVGISIAIAGILISTLAGASSTYFTIGDIEAIAAALSNALAITIYAKLLVNYNTVEVSGFALLISGVILNVVQWVFFPPHLAVFDWLFMLAFSVIALTAFLLYNMSIKKIGSSMTSIITSSALVLTMVIQLAFIPFGIIFTLPANITLAFVGGGVSLFGIYLGYRSISNSNFEKKVIIV